MAIKSSQRQLDATLNDNFTAVDSEDNWNPVLSKNKTPIVFDSLATGKRYLTRRFKKDWTRIKFQMARYKLQPDTEVTYVSNS